MNCTNNAENNNEMDGVEVIHLCSFSQNKTGAGLVRIKIRHLSREKKAQSKKVRTSRNMAQQSKWKWNKGP